MPMGGSILVITGMMILFGYGLYLIRPVIYVTNLFTYGIPARHFLKQGLLMRSRIVGLLPWIVFGVIFGFFIGHNLQDHLVGYLLGLFALVMGAIALYDVYGPLDEAPVVTTIVPANPEEELNSFVEHIGLAQEQKANPKKVLVENVMMGTPLGLLTGILGVSGGVTEQFYQKRIAGISAPNALANTTIMVFIASLTAALISFFYGTAINAFSWQTPLTLAMILIPCTYAGALLGAKYRAKLSLKSQRWLFAISMILIALTMLTAQ